MAEPVEEYKYIRINLLGFRLSGEKIIVEQE